MSNSKSTKRIIYENKPQQKSNSSSSQTHIVKSDEPKTSNDQKPKPSTDVTIAVSNSIFTQIDQMKKLTGKTEMLENTIQSIEEEVKRYREEIAGLKKTLHDTIDEHTQKKLEYNKLQDRYGNLKSQFDSQAEKLNTVYMKQHENNSSNDTLLRENQMLKDKVQNLDNKVQELNIEIQEG